MTIQPALRCCGIALLFCSTLSLIGCTPAEEQLAEQWGDTVATMLTTHADLVQAKRDVKDLPPTTPGVRETKAAWEKVFHNYNRYLDLVEDGINTSHSRSLAAVQPEEVQRDVMNFLSQAVVTLDPGTDTRAMQLDRIPMIPRDFSRTIKKLKKSQREEILSKLDKQIRLQPWDDD